MADPDICVIMNAGSGKGNASEKIRELEAEFERFPNRFTLRTVKSGGRISAAAAKAVQDGFPAVAAAGGDGTICAVAASLVDTEARLGVIPLGTFNYFARSLDLPEELPQAVAVVAEGEARPVRIGDVNGQIFLNNASLGAYPAILERREEVYRKWGRSRIAAYWSVLTTLVRLKARLHLTVSMDGEERKFRTPLAFVANNPYQLEMVGLEGADCVSAGHLALFIAPDSTRLKMLAHALRLASGATSPDRDFELLCGGEIRMETRRRRLLLARDGERARQDGPFSFRVRHNALRVLLPRASG